MVCVKNTRKVFLSVSLILFVLMIAVPAIASTAFPKPVGFVNDFAKQLSMEDSKTLNQEIMDFEKRTSAEIAVVTVVSLNGENINDYATSLATEWGIGKKDKNNGIVFIIAPSEHLVRIATANGIMAKLPNEMTDRIINEIVTPNFKKGNMAKGIMDGTRAIMHVIDNGSLPVNNPESKPITQNDRLEFIVFISIIGAFIAIVILWFVISSIVINRNARRYVEDNKDSIANRIAEISSNINNPDISDDTKETITKLNKRFSKIINNIEKMSWADKKEEILSIDNTLIYLGDNIPKELKFAKKAKSNGPELLNKVSTMVESAKRRLEDGNVSEYYKKCVHKASKQVASIQQDSLINWVIVYALLLSIQSDISPNREQYQPETYNHSLNNYSNNDSFGMGSGSFGGGSGFDTGGGSTGTW